MGAPGGMLETVVQERPVPGGTPIPVKKSRLSTKMAAVVAGAGTVRKENGTHATDEGQDKGPAADESVKEEGHEMPENAMIADKMSPSPLPGKGFRMSEPGPEDTWKEEAGAGGEVEVTQGEGAAEDGAGAGGEVEVTQGEGAAEDGTRAVEG